MADRASGSSRDINWKLISIGVLVLVLVVFAIANSHDVNVDYVVGSFDTSMIVVIVISAAVGAGLGALLMHRRDSRSSD